VTVQAFSCVELNCAEPGFVPVIESDQGFMCLNLSALCSLFLLRQRRWLISKGAQTKPSGELLF